ncbi:MAG TPA: protein-L-isoaspartate O-methyltransferase [Pseudolabrys sp.]|jgi:protein-L-isoaspartate(D-aspartate) O-methyltransferase|nr:protein-L-isoaspartate O-methyltransferase [Pseudolabrys sp.]
MTDFAAARRNMVEGQVRTADVTDLRIIAAMLEVPRERFLPAAVAGLAYLDFDVPLPAAPGRRLLKPMVLSKLIHAGAIKATDRVLDVGCATGYGAAILARMAAEVVALEENAALAEMAKANLSDQPHVSVVNGKLADGWPVGTPYDVILVEGATEIEPTPLCRQLADRGRLLCILGAGPAAKASVLSRTGDDIGVRHVFDATAAVLPGFVKPLEFAF